VPGILVFQVNRVLQRLRRQELITLNLVIDDVDRLNGFSGYNANYLPLRDRLQNLQRIAKQKVVDVRTASECERAAESRARAEDGSPS
jgi:hypothetical protein